MCVTPWLQCHLTASIHELLSALKASKWSVDQIDRLRSISIKAPLTDQSCLTEDGVIICGASCGLGCEEGKRVSKNSFPRASIWVFRGNPFYSRTQKFEGCVSVLQESMDAIRRHESNTAVLVVTLTSALLPWQQHRARANGEIGKTCDDFLIPNFWV